VIISVVKRYGLAAEDRSGRGLQYLLTGAVFAAVVSGAALADEPAHSDTPLYPDRPIAHEMPAAAEAIPGVSGAPITPETGFIADSPRRLPDGTFFVPKPSQRLLTLRTVVATAMNVQRTDEIPGYIIADPNASGEVQSHQSGRLEPVEGGMPLVGTAVTKGQLLAYVNPTVSRVERGTIFSQAAELAVDIEVKQRQVAFLQDFPIVPFRERKLEAARIQLEGLRKRYEVLTRALSAKVALRSPVDGVIARVHALPGQIVDARQPVFHIVDPKRLLVEATAIDAHVPDQIRTAYARLTDGTMLPLRFVGRGPQLREQAVPLLFAFDGPTPPINVGATTTIVVHGFDTRSAIVLPRESVVRAASGETVVWEKLNAERFVARPVVVRPLDGDRLSIVAGLAVGVRAVTSGANLLNNAR
jgi:multidrug efflux pump subunit AcrA (membrane-fusion protein)